MVKIISYNCNSIKNNLDVIRDLLQKCDIILLQEIILLKQELDLIKHIDLNFDGVGFASDAGEIGMLRGRPKAGVAILWKKTLGNFIKPIFCNESIIAVQMTSPNEILFLVNVYFPCDRQDVDSLCKYRNMLAILDCFLDENKFNNVILAGDFNADPGKGRFWKELLPYVQYKQLSIKDLDLPINSFTYLSPGHNTTSWLDHILSSSAVKISNVFVEYNAAAYDHFPLSFDVEFKFDMHIGSGVTDTLLQNFVNWKTFGEPELNIYHNKLDSLLNMNNFNDAVLCTNQNCADLSHKAKLDEAYAFVVDSIINATDDFRVNKSNKTYVVPGWNEHVKELHAMAREKFKIWRENGKIRLGNHFQEMKDSRRDFRYSLDHCKRNEARIRNENLVNSLENKDTNKFWKEINKSNKANKTNSISNIDGKSDSIEIASIFLNNFGQVFDNVECQEKPDGFDAFQRDLDNSERTLRISVNDISTSIHSLNTGIGFDGVHSNHLKYAPDSLKTFLSKLFSSFLVHSYTPEKMLHGVIRPLCKNKYGDQFCSNNYRPVMISSNMLKIFEYCLLPHLCESANISDFQFGFREHTSTMMAALILKEALLKYTNSGSTIYTAFLDLSKAFDRVNHYHLLTKLSNLGISKTVVKILLNMLSKQYFNVNVNGTYSDRKKIGNGVRQGGIISPLLFAIYMNDILTSLSKIKTGCRIGGNLLNIMAYADDVVLVSPSVTGLQQLLSEFHAGIESLSLKMNVEKSTSIVFRPKSLSTLSPPMFFINGKKLKSDDCIKYLGVFFNEKLCNDKDILRSQSSFLRSFNVMYRKFYNVNKDILINLLKSYCLSFYGTELWYNNFKCAQLLKQFSVAYHKSIKRILKISTHSSNHEACEISDMFTFKHFVNFKKISFMYRILNSRSCCIAKFKNYLKSESFAMKDVLKILRDEYGLETFMENDLDAIKSRIKFVQLREERLR